VKLEITGAAEPEPEPACELDSPTLQAVTIARSTTAATNNAAEQRRWRGETHKLYVPDSELAFIVVIILQQLYK
jgi:hypothetical protein